jgi:hypothetical protein
MEQVHRRVLATPYHARRPSGDQNRRPSATYTDHSGGLPRESGYTTRHYERVPRSHHPSSANVRHTNTWPTNTRSMYTGQTPQQGYVPPRRSHHSSPYDDPWSNNIHTPRSPSRQHTPGTRGGNQSRSNSYSRESELEQTSRRTPSMPRYSTHHGHYSSTQGSRGRNTAQPWGSPASGMDNVGVADIYPYPNAPYGQVPCVPSVVFTTSSVLDDEEEYPSTRQRSQTPRDHARHRRTSDYRYQR